MGHLLRLIALLALAVALLPAAATVAAAPAAPATPVDGLAASVRDQYIITLKPGVSAKAFAQGNGIATTYVYDKALNGFTAKLNLRQLAALKRNPAVLRVEADQVVQAAPRSGSGGASIQAIPWNLDRIDQQFLPLSGSYTTASQGQSANVYVIDTGIQTTNAQFSGRAFVAYDTFGGNGQDCHGNGTYIAGVVGGTTYGVAKQARLWSVRALNCTGAGTTSGILNAINWVTANHQPRAIAVIAFGSPNSSTVNTAVANMIAANVFTAVAASSSGDACNFTPGSVATAMTTAASNAADQAVGGSGPCIDIYAPGANVQGPSLTGVVTRSGTTPAAAHVAGVAALYKATYGEQPSATVTSGIISTATVGVLTGVPPSTVNRLLYTAGL
ncbi:MAG TPA: S8 family peptidase [Roseiflexaceae bacterium]|nr:S8 family peptidase [Roseiflexaceae bacterium]